MTASWEKEAMRIAAAIADVTSIAPREVQLNDRLIEFTYQPANQDAAAMSVFVSSSEVIFCAGEGTRFELGGPLEAAAEVEQLARSVAAGRLKEILEGRKVRFVLELEDGSEVSGTTNLHNLRPKVRSRVIEYSSYRASDP